jgi:2-oxoglutarate ferredoxin oxidoreductase subunit delta
VFLKKDHCKGCELCIEFCPRNVLARSKGFNAKGYHNPVVTNGDCINCRLCVTVCPEFAIFSVAAAHRMKVSPGGYPAPDLGARPGWEPCGDA